MTERIKELKALSLPIMQFIHKYYHPHVKVIIDQTNAELVEGLMSINVEYHEISKPKEYQHPCPYGFDQIVPTVLEDSDGFWVVLSNNAPWDADIKDCIKVDSVEDGHRVIALMQRVHDGIDFKPWVKGLKNVSN